MDLISKNLINVTWIVTWHKSNMDTSYVVGHIMYYCTWQKRKRGSKKYRSARGRKLDWSLDLSKKTGNGKGGHQNLRNVVPRVLDGELLVGEVVELRVPGVEDTDGRGSEGHDLSGEKDLLISQHTFCWHTFCRGIKYQCDRFRNFSVNINASKMCLANKLCNYVEIQASPDHSEDGDGRSTDPELQPCKMT